MKKESENKYMTDEEAKKLGYMDVVEVEISEEEYRKNKEQGILAWDSSDDGEIAGMNVIHIKREEE